jgi:hypothetical protein
MTTAARRDKLRRPDFLSQWSRARLIRVNDITEAHFTHTIINLPKR